MKSLAILVVVVVQAVLAHREYMDRMPNGHKVPNPCKSGEIWEAVGHSDPDSGHHGENHFGKDFKHAGDKHWNTRLCQMDSDGDGQTNGAELGDPDCKWTPGATPAGPAKSHPGICEPVSSPSCHSPC